MSKLISKYFLKQLYNYYSYSIAIKASLDVTIAIERPKIDVMFRLGGKNKEAEVRSKSVIWLIITQAILEVKALQMPNTLK